MHLSICFFPSRRFHHGYAFQQGLGPDVGQQRDADFDVGFGCGWEDHHFVSLEVSRSRDHHSNRWIQRGDGGIQEHQVQRLGCRKGPKGKGHLRGT